MAFMLVSCNRDLHLRDVVVTDRLYSPDSTSMSIGWPDSGSVGVLEFLGTLKPGRNIKMGIRSRLFMIQRSH
jgi:hypothetical protein